MTDFLLLCDVVLSRKRRTNKSRLARLCAPRKYTRKASHRRPDRADHNKNSSQKFKAHAIFNMFLIRFFFIYRILLHSKLIVVDFWSTSKNEIYFFVVAAASTQSNEFSMGISTIVIYRKSAIKGKKKYVK